YISEPCPFVLRIAYPVGLIAQTGSVWATVGVTVERLFARTGGQKGCAAIFAVAYKGLRDEGPEDHRRGCECVSGQAVLMNKLYYEFITLPVEKQDRSCLKPPSLGVDCLFHVNVKCLWKTGFPKEEIENNFNFRKEIRTKNVICGRELRH
ncbi:hypothetical protein JTE90_024408, partial [Oedothorax gibbosus]